MVWGMATGLFGLTAECPSCHSVVEIVTRGYSGQGLFWALHDTCSNSGQEYFA